MEFSQNIYRTPSGARLKLFQSSSKEGSYNWLFLPGGPGLGSESLHPLLEILELPGSSWTLDLPGDGSNVAANNSEAFSHWQEALIEAAGAFDKPILVAHSTGAMFALATPELETLLAGLVLLDSAPDRHWKQAFASRTKSLDVSEIEKAEAVYKKGPSNATLKALVIAGAPLMFTEEGFEKGVRSLYNLPYNYEAFQWAEEHFDPIYEAKWAAEKLPTLILAGSEDLATPLSLYSEQKRFQRKNILLKEIAHAGHFPWIENPAAVKAAFDAYCARLIGL